MYLVKMIYVVLVRSNQEVDIY